MYDTRLLEKLTFAAAMLVAGRFVLLFSTSSTQAISSEQAIAAPPIPFQCSVSQLTSCVTELLSPGALNHSANSILSASLPSASLSRWDSQSAVYLTPGPDGAPGEQGVDDDGDGVVDNLSELGGTGTDDRVVTPADGEAYQRASADKFARMVSRGAMVPIWSSSDPKATQLDQLKIETSTVVRIDFVDQQGKLHSRFVELR